MDKLSGYNYVAVVKSDTKTINFLGLYVGTGGDVAVSSDGGVTSVTFANVIGGTFLPVSGDRVMSTNTTASDIVRLIW